MNIRFGTEITAAAAAHHLDPKLLAAVAAQETGGPGSNSGNNIVGDGGHGHGVFQIDDRSWAFARTAAAMEPAKNADVAAGILSDNLQRFGGNVKAALSAYNTGSPTATGTTTQWGDGKTLGYADSVLRHFDALGGSAEQVAADARGAMATADPLQSAGQGQASAASLGMPVAYAGAPAASPANFAASLPPSPLTPAAPMRSWSQITASSSNETAAADKSMADLVDSGDVFGSEDDSSVDN